MRATSPSILCTSQSAKVEVYRRSATPHCADQTQRPAQLAKAPRSLAPMRGDQHHLAAIEIGEGWRCPRAGCGSSTDRVDDRRPSRRPSPRRPLPQQVVAGLRPQNATRERVVIWRLALWKRRPCGSGNPFDVPDRHARIEGRRRGHGGGRHSAPGPPRAPAAITSGRRSRMRAATWLATALRA
jgi:hypothetical protein